MNISKIAKMMAPYGGANEKKVRITISFSLDAKSLCPNFGDMGIFYVQDGMGFLLF